MKKMKLTTGLLLLATASTITVQKANANGYEKSIAWGGHEAALAGAAVPWVSGANALYFNPAGLVTDKPGSQVSIQLSPVQSQNSGPVDTNNDQVNSLATTSLPGALIYSNTLNDRFGFGAGLYTSLGSKTEYDNVAMPGTVAQTATLYTNLTVLEFGLGGAYKVTDKLKLGLAYRVVMAQANLGMVSNLAANGSAFLNLQVNNAQQTSYSNFKLGSQYQLADKTFLGLTFRSETPLSMPGNFSGVYSAAQAVPVDTKQATINTVLPMAIDLGASQEYENWRAFAQYTWTQYSRIGEIPVSGVLSAMGTTIKNGVNIPTRWSDENDIRLAGEYKGYSWPIRFGYMLSTQVTDANQAGVNFYAPGLGHTLTAGTGQTWTTFGNPLTLDLAAELGRVSGSGGVNAAGVGLDSSTNSTRAGTYTNMIYALHAGVTYGF